jgi:hypothetical protein
MTIVPLARQVDQDIAEESSAGSLLAVILQGARHAPQRLLDGAI